MRWSFVALACAVAGMDATAADPRWMEIVKARDGEVTSIEVNSVKKSGSVVMAWFKSVPGKAPVDGKRASTKMRVKFDCSAERSTLLSVATYRTDGTVISTEQSRFPDNNWQDVMPGSIGQDMMENACALGMAP